MITSSLQSGNSEYRSITRTFAIFIISAITLLITLGCDPTPHTDSEYTAFVNVTVLPMDHEGALENQTVVVSNGRILEMGSADDIDVPSSAYTIDGVGRFLMPGLAEMHGHIPGEDHPEYAKNVLFLYISNGVTTVRNMLGSPYHLELRDRVNAGELRGPRIFAASPWMHNDQVPENDDVRELVKEYAETGFDLIKMGSISPDRYQVMAETAHEVGIPFAGHIPPGVDLEGAIAAGQVSIDHFDRYVEFLADVNSAEVSTGFFGSSVMDQVDRSRIPLAVQKTVDSGIWNVPTLSLIEHLATTEPGEEMIEWPEMQYMPQDVLDGWVEFKNNIQARDDFQQDTAQEMVSLRQELLRELHAAGAPIALGSDAPQFFNVPGFSIHHEMRMMVDAGLTPFEVLETGTRKPAFYFGMEDDFGIVAPGMRADLILLNANPFEDIAHVKDRTGVMVNGRWFSEEAIQDELRRMSRSN